ncbi:ABC transporter substrate-binding protein [Neobacillus drentensis]|uniref:ABC transporter substrate-binding protein n=1 Tax=Neobacillus drentensis TaxID=220684 RepID=UPI000825A5AF|nr:ABC transporter substrate-binding protein [Neobacillus drentensis]
MKKKLSMFVTIFMVAILIIGCSSKGTSGTGKESNSSSKNVTSKPDRPFVYVAQQVVGSVDPAKHVDETELIAVLNTYDPLVYPKVEEGSMEPGPHIAESWKVSDDGKVYTFKIKEGVTFQSGNKLTAKDIVFSVQRMMAIKQGFSWLWSGVLNPDNVKALDDYTVEFTLDNAYAPFVSTLTQLFIVDSATILANKEAGDFGDNGDYGQKYLESHVAGSGPYLLTKWDRGSQLTFAKYDKYWKGWSEGKIEDWQMKIITEQATVKTMLNSGDADMVHQWLTVDTYKEFSKADGIVVDEQPSVQLQHIPINTQKAPTDDINVRKAILTAFDYSVATKQILGGATQAQGPVPNLVPGHNDKVTVYKKDIKKAKEYLAKSKYAGQDLEVEFMYLSDTPSQRQLAQLIQSNLKEIGIKVKLIGGPWTQVTEATAKVETTPHMVVISDTLKYPHVDSHTYGIYHPSAHGSYRSSSWYDDPATTEVLEKARKSVDVDEQMTYYKEAQKLIVDNAPSIYIANPNHRIAFRDYVKGYKYVGILGYDLGFYYLSVK